jgi:hypothetical protein
MVKRDSSLSAERGSMSPRCVLQDRVAERSKCHLAPAWAMPVSATGSGPLFSISCQWIASKVSVDRFRWGGDILL